MNLIIKRLNLKSFINNDIKYIVARTNHILIIGYCLIYLTYQMNYNKYATIYIYRKLLHMIHMKIFNNLLDSLAKLKTKAIRSKVWFMQNLHDRILTNLIVKNIKNINSKLLAITVSRLIVKLLNATKYAFNKMLEGLGKPIVINMHRSASSMGWDADHWLDDPFIIRWYGLQAYNSPLYTR